MSENIETLSGTMPAAPLGRMMGWLYARGTLVTGITIGVIILFLGFVGPLLYRVNPYAINPTHALATPSLVFPFGTDELGRDELALVLSGGLYTLVISLPAAILAFFVGVGYGLASGLGPAWLDRLLMRLLDAILALPSLIILIFFASLVELSNTNLIFLIGFISWPSLARLVRNETLAQRGRDFVLAAEQLGAGRIYIGRVHLIRVMAPILVVNGTFMIGDSIFSLSSLSFLGLGVQPPYASWGQLLESSLDLIALNPWWLIMPPGLLVFGSLIAASLTGQGLLLRYGGGNR